MLADIETGFFVFISLLTDAGRDLTTGQIRASSVISRRLRFSYLTAHTVQPNEFKLVFLPERWQKVVVGDA